MALSCGGCSDGRVRTASGPETNSAIFALSFMSKEENSRRATPNMAVRTTDNVGGSAEACTGLGKGEERHCCCSGGGGKRSEATTMSLRSFISL